MNVSERRVSFNDIQSAALKSFTSAAMRVGSSDASNLVMGPTPPTPWRMLRHISAAPLPTGETTPRPVTTTLRFDIWRARIHEPARSDGGMRELLLDVVL